MPRSQDRPHISRALGGAGHDPYALVEQPAAVLAAEAAARRDALTGARVTFSPKVFLPLTNLCRNACDYCSFRRSPKDAGGRTMSPDEVARALDGAAAAGCTEALFCLGDTPETVFPSYAKTLGSWGFGSTVEYLAWGGERALERGLLPHTNAGILSRREMARLAEVNVSLGLMMESTSERLCGKGMPHHRAPDKRPARRIAMTAEAGALAIAFTSGVLVGIGETRRERIDTLVAIRDLHRAGGHIQEVIVQNFRAHAGTPMAGFPEPATDELVWTVAAARVILDDDVSVQAPPNLTPGGAAELLAAGVDDFGGISPVTPDFINPGWPWPHIDELAAACAGAGYRLAPRLPIYDRYAARPGFVRPALREHVARARERLAAFDVAPRATEGARA